MVQILVLEMLFKRKKEIFLIKTQGFLLYKISNKYFLKVEVKLQKENNYIIIK